MAIITISRGSMSGGEALATCLAQTLNYPIIGREVLITAAEQLGVTEELLTQKFKQGPKLWERLTSNRRLYLVAIQAALAEHTASGNLIYHGHAGHLLLRQLPNILRIRLIAPMEMRIQAVMERQHLDRQGAEEYIHHVDEERVRWTKFLYGADWSDPALYDLVINLEKLTVKTACRTVKALVAEPEFQITEQVKQSIQDLRLACKVKFALASNRLTKDVAVEVRSDSGVIELSGSIPQAGIYADVGDRDKDLLVATVRAVEGVRDVVTRLQ